MNDLVVRKLNLQHEETWRYEGRTLRQTPTQILIEAFFNHEDILFHGILFNEGDRFVELYYSDRWYNIFEVHDREDQRIKGYYCNISLPAKIRPGEITFVDLALDLLVYPDGRQLILDEDEFAALDITALVREEARMALTDLQSLFEARTWQTLLCVFNQ